jgi:hypothetical protein
MPRAGFGAAVQHAVVTGLRTLARWPVPNRITSDLREAVQYLLDPDEPVLEPLAQFCVEQRTGPSAG